MHTAGAQRPIPPDLGPETFHRARHSDAERADVPNSVTRYQSTDLTPQCSASATLDRMGTVGLRELRQEASDLVRRVESGEVIEVTVSGRLAARLVPARPRQWLDWTEVSDCFLGRADPTWQQDRDLIDQHLDNPWDHRPGQGE